jgi:hypothetical protein
MARQNAAVLVEQFNIRGHLFSTWSIQLSDGLLPSHGQNVADLTGKDCSDPMHGSDVQCLDAPFFETKAKFCLIH